MGIVPLRMKMLFLKFSTWGENRLTQPLWMKLACCVVIGKGSAVRFSWKRSPIIGNAMTSPTHHRKPNSKHFRLPHLKLRKMRMWFISVYRYLYFMTLGVRSCEISLAFFFHSSKIRASCFQRREHRILFNSISPSTATFVYLQNKMLMWCHLHLRRSDRFPVRQLSFEYNIFIMRCHPLCVWTDVRSIK